LKLYSYDISSAYPYEASQLTDLRDCDFTFSANLDLSALYGLVYGDLYINPQSKYAYCSPVLTRLPDGQLTNAVGHLPTDYYSLDLIKHIYKYGMGRFSCDGAWYIHPRDGIEPRYPFKGLMEQFFAQRTPDNSPYSINVVNTCRADVKAKAELQSYFVKRIMTGLVGMMLQTKKLPDNVIKYGELYNPIYHSIILARTACRVSEFIIKNGITQSELVHVGVDGVKATKYIPDIPTTAGMGQWRCSGSQPTIILSPAGIWTSERSPQNVPLGILQALFGAKPSSSRYAFDGWEVDLRTLPAKQNRRFVKLPKTGGQLLGNQYQSEPVVID
jgi:hypothetical protein